MKKLIILSLILLFSCGKESSVNEPHHPRDWRHGNDWDDTTYPYAGFWDIFNTGKWPNLDPYWTTYNRYSFYYTRYTCTGTILTFCSSQTVGQDGKEFFNVYSKISSENRHPYGNTFGQVIAGISTLITPFGVGFKPEFVPVGVSQNGLTYYLFQSADQRTRFGINPYYPAWANPVFQEEITGNTVTGYYLSHWLYW